MRIEVKKGIIGLIVLSFFMASWMFIIAGIEGPEAVERDYEGFFNFIIMIFSFGLTFWILDPFSKKEELNKE